MSALLEVRGLTVELPTPAGWVRPVNEVSLRIAEGESLGLVGESGSGKTMLSQLAPPNRCFTSQRTTTPANCFPPFRSCRAPERLFSVACSSCFGPF
jgi:ABC-type phosphonate transport system ATPase subunit